MIRDDKNLIICIQLKKMYLQSSQFQGATHMGVSVFNRALVYLNHGMKIKIQLNKHKNGQNLVFLIRQEQIFHLLGIKDTWDNTMSCVNLSNHTIAKSRAPCVSSRILQEEIRDVNLKFFVNCYGSRCNSLYAYHMIVGLSYVHCEQFGDSSVRQINSVPYFHL